VSKTRRLQSVPARSFPASLRQLIAHVASTRSKVTLLSPRRCRSRGRGESQRIWRPCMTLRQVVLITLHGRVDCCSECFITSASQSQLQTEGSAFDCTPLRRPVQRRGAETAAPRFLGRARQRTAVMQPSGEGSSTHKDALNLSKESSAHAAEGSTCPYSSPRSIRPS
jgi:hypothetical protein